MLFRRGRNTVQCEQLTRRGASVPVSSALPGRHVKLPRGTLYHCGVVDGLPSTSCVVLLVVPRSLCNHPRWAVQLCLVRRNQEPWLVLPLVLLAALLPSGAGRTNKLP